MRVVPENRLLIQPTVQLKWIEQHTTIEFQLPNDLQVAFLKLWAKRLASAELTLPAFLNTPAILEKNLFDNDPLFALLTGADYILQKHPQFSSYLENDRLVWSIEAS